MASTLTPYVASLSGLTGTANNNSLSWTSASTYAFANLSATGGQYVAGIFDGANVNRWFYSCYSSTGPYGQVNLPTIDNPANLPTFWGDGLTVETNPFQEQGQVWTTGLVIDTGGPWYLKVTFAVGSPDANSSGYFTLSEAAMIIISSTATGQT